MPRRIQLSRAKGDRKPADAIAVTRPGLFGNPFAVVRPMRVIYSRSWRVVFSGRRSVRPRWAVETETARHASETAAAKAAVDAFRRWLSESGQAGLIERARRELRGKDLACWCPADRPCHADVWLELANTLTLQKVR